jgi:tripartite-type tricarboxylate transporter receptor subunit TctC
MHGRNAVLSSANHKRQSQGPITRANDKGQDKEEPPMRRRDLLALSLAALPMALRPAAAQSKYPERPIRLVIPFPPGGVYDAVGRPWADRVKPTLGTVVVENIGGAGGALGAAAVARAPSDGYTLLLGGGGALVLTPIASSRPPFDPVRDFEPIALLVTTGLAIVVHPALPEKTLAELIDYARSNPGKLSYGSAGVGSMNQLAGELFKSLSGAADIVHVPYKGFCYKSIVEHFLNDFSDLRNCDSFRDLFVPS